MKVSVVIPLYNKAPFIEACLASLAAQTFTDFEVIVADDASTDDGLERVRRFPGLRIRTRRLDRNLGPSGAVQRAIDMAEGEYIVRVDADDLMLPERLERQVRFMDADPTVGASGGSAVLFGSEEGTLAYPEGDEECRAELLFGVPVSQPGSILRAAVLRRSGVRFEDDWPRIGEDWLFCAALSRHTRFANMTAPVIQYRRGPQNSTHGIDRVARFRPMVTRLLTFLDLPHDERSVELHLMALAAFGKDVDVRSLRDLHGWFDRLRQWNATTRFCAPAVFDARVKRQWDRLFYLLALRSTASAVAHMRADGAWTTAKVGYLMKRAVKNAFRRKNK